jgi:hypothetical protein
VEPKRRLPSFGAGETARGERENGWHLASVIPCPIRHPVNHPPAPVARSSCAPPIIPCVHGIGAPFTRNVATPPDPSLRSG